MGGAHLHTPQSIFQHMMGQQNTPHQSGPWPQMPQVPPMMMPWSIPSLQQSQLVRFTGERPPIIFTKSALKKRKYLTNEPTEIHRAKQFITEEKMAAHFQDMHISSNYSENSAGVSSGVREPQPCCSTSNDDIHIDLDMENDPTRLENGKSVHPRLVISEELKRLQQEPLLPGSLLAKLETRPSMALVLWEPPSKHLRMLSNRQNVPQSPNDSNTNNNNSDRSNNDNSENFMQRDNESGNNNHENIPDMNQSRMEDQINRDLEPMDL
ncbi:bromodomain-containing protein DDB_G0280777-like isoform X2 [Venturia canescens]|nr:bromodomain-containing protein DDB_G0280777-like isoform X2 [Venturia canescens]